MSTRAENVEYLLDQIDTVLKLKAETLIKTSFKSVLVSLNSEGKFQEKSVDAAVTPENFKAEIHLDVSSLPHFIQRGILSNQFNYCIEETETRQHQHSSPHFSNAEKPSQHNTGETADQVQ